MDMIKVVCGVIYKADKIFICRRKQNKTLGGYWEFPGGKVEQGETNEICLQRELQEELGMKVEVGNYITTVQYDYKTFKIELIAYKCSFIEATLDLVDHDKYEWLEVKDLNKYKLAPADVPIVERLEDVS